MTTKTWITKIGFILVAQLIAFSSFAAESLLQQAEQAYKTENYDQAVAMYDSILKIKGPSAEVYYNLGNAYYKLGKIAPSIINYERALRQDPGDSDIRFNLNMANQRTVDKIEPVGEFFLKTWSEALQNKGALDSWAKLGVVCFLLFLLCAALYVFTRKVRLKQIGFFVGVLCLHVVFIANIFASQQKKKIIDHKAAIIFAPTVTIKSTPDGSGTDLFVLHEGTKVSVKSTLGEWKEIELVDGNVGWIPSADIQAI